MLEQGVRQYLAVGLIGWCVALALAAWAFRRWRTRSTARRRAQRVTAAVLALTFGHLACDAALLAFFVRSDGLHRTLLDRIWIERHWRVNADGMRDADHTVEGLAGRRLVVVLGDSFAAGYGIEDVADRFPDRLAAALGPGHAVVNLSFPGWDTRAEVVTFHRFKLDPQVVVLSYMVNDIHGVARERFATLAPPEPSPLDAYRRRSPFGDLVLFQLWWARSGVSPSRHSGDLAGAFADERAWALHARDLDRLADMVRDRGARLVVVLFPSLQDVAGTAPLTARVAEHLRARGATTLDLAPLLAGRAPRDLVVNAYDAHPNVALHHEVADLLLPLVAEAAPVTTR